MGGHGKRRWIEKTPAHLPHVDRIRTAFPDAPIIRIVRDPRDVCASLVGLPILFDNVVLNASTLNEWHLRSRRFFLTDANVMTVRYEEFVRSPVEWCRRICHFIGEEYSPVMLVPSEADGLLVSRHEYWKRDVSTPVDASRASRGRGRLKPWEIQACTSLCADIIDEFGYECDAHSTMRAGIVAVDADCYQRSAWMLARLAERGIALVSPSSDRKPDVLVFPDPMSARSRRKLLRYAGAYLGFVLKALSGQVRIYKGSDFSGWFYVRRFLRRFCQLCFSRQSETEKPGIG